MILPGRTEGEWVTSTDGPWCGRGAGRGRPANASGRTVIDTGAEVEEHRSARGREANVKVIRSARYFRQTLTPWDCHRTADQLEWFWGVNVGIYGRPMECLGNPSLSDLQTSKKQPSQFFRSVQVCGRVTGLVRGAPHVLRITGSHRSCLGKVPLPHRTEQNHPLF